MRWVETPVVAPYKCALCNNGPENPRCPPFLVTEWRYSEESGVEFREQLAARELRLMICSMCWKAAMAAPGAPAQPKLTPPAPPTTTPEAAGVSYQNTAKAGLTPGDVEKITESVVQGIIKHEQEKSAARMAKARAARGKRE
jgi:hypothetical protein